MAVHHLVGISRQRNSGYRPSRVNRGTIKVSPLPIPPLALHSTHLSIRRGLATTTHYTHHHVSLMVSRNTTLVPSLGLRIGPACEAGLGAGMRRERVSPQITKKRKKYSLYCRGNYSATLSNMKLIHWPLMGGLLRSVHRGGDWAGPQPRPLLAVPNVTVHPSTASVSITVLLYNDPLLCGLMWPCTLCFKKVHPFAIRNN